MPPSSFRVRKTMEQKRNRIRICWRHWYFNDVNKINCLLMAKSVRGLSKITLRKKGEAYWKY